MTIEIQNKLIENKLLSRAPVVDSTQLERELRLAVELDCGSSK